MDNVIDTTNYPMVKQKMEAESKRRMGLGITGLGNALTLIDLKYGSLNARNFIKKIMKLLTWSAYEASADLALEKGSFPLFEADKYIESGFIKKLPTRLKDKIKQQGIRNSHLISIAPTGTISFCADNISSGSNSLTTLASIVSLELEDLDLGETL